MIILSKTILIRHLGTISYPYTPSDHQIYLLIISLHLKIDCVNVYGHLVYDITKLRLLQVCVDYTVKNDLDSAAGHHFLPYTPSDNQIYLLIISLQLKIDCVNVYVHLVYDIIKLRLLQGCVDYNVKNNLDSASGHHFLPIYTYRSSNIIIDHFIATKNRLRQRLCAFSEDIIKLRLLQGCVDYNVKNNLDSASGHHFLPIYPSDHQI